jgi:ABC-type antimicrobial peptide transport system permease subunit
MKTYPPTLPLRFFRWYCHPKLLDHIEGDLIEVYQQRLNKVGKRKADLKFVGDVLLLFRPSIIRPIEGYKNLNTYGMYKSYFKIGWRNIRRSLVYSSINVFGLAIGLACCLSIGLYIQDEFSYDSFHQNLGNLYRVVEKQKQAGIRYDIASTPGPLGPAMKTDFPEVKETCRLGYMPGVLQLDQSTAETNAIRLTDNSFFNMFNFKLIKGNPRTIFLNPNEVVLTTSLADRLLEPEWRTNKNLLGKIIQLTSWGNEYTLSLAGIAEDAPSNSHIVFDALVSFSIVAANKDDYSWDNNSYDTYIQLHANADVVQFDHKLTKYIDKYSTFGSKDEQRTLRLQPMRDIYLHSKFDFETDSSKNNEFVYVQVFSAVAVMVLLIAIFNFVNLSTARAIQRAKEVGVRKVVGAFRNQLIKQFLTESLMLTLLSFCIAMPLLQLLLPVLNAIAGKSLYIPFNQPAFLIIFVFSIFSISILAGFYPAFYLSSFKPAKVLKGQLQSGSGSRFRSVLVVCQFTFSIVLLISTVVVYKQLKFIEHKNLGFDQSHLLYVRLKDDMREQALLFKSELLNQSSIASASTASVNLIDVTNSTTTFAWEGKAKEDEMLITQINIDADYLHTTGIQLVAGRNFSGSKSDSTSFLINEKAAQRMGWNAAQAVGKSITTWNTKGTVIGVVNDFHFRPITMPIEPLVFRCWAKSRYNGVFVKTSKGRTKEALSAIEKVYKTHQTKRALDIEFVDQSIERQYRTEQNTGRIVLFFSVLVILVSCLGLYGLATYAAEQRTKEIGIRKVLGASVSGIIQLLSKDFLKHVLIAIVIAAQAGWWCMTRWLQSFAYKIDLEWWMFAIAGLLSIAIALLTVGYQSLKAALANPVNSLKSE